MGTIKLRSICYVFNLFIDYCVYFLWFSVLCCVLTLVCYRLHFGHSLDNCHCAKSVAPRTASAGWKVSTGWQAAANHLRRNALSKNSPGLLAGAPADGEGHGAELDYSLCFLELS